MSTEGNSSLELRSDTLCDELCVEVGVLDFDDIDCDGLLELLLTLSAELLDLRAALTDDHTGFRAVDVNTDLLAVSLDFDLGNTCCCELLLQITAEVIVLNQCINPNP